MPSVGMRRSTRVLGARVLRSGRRLWTEPPHEDGKFIRVARENEWIGILDDSMDGGDAGEPCKDSWHGNNNGSAMVIVEEHKLEVDTEKEVGDVKNMDKMWGIVYVRKRKREALETSGSCEDKRFGKKFFRRKWKKIYRAAAPLEIGVDFSDDTATHQKLSIVAVKPSYDSSHWISCFLCSVLYFMRRIDIRLRLLSEFVHWKPLSDSYSSHGILFLQGSVPVKSPGFCIISGSRSLIPMLSVDFSAVPFCFMYLHSSMQLRSARVAYVFFVVPLGANENFGEVTSQISLRIESCNSGPVVSRIGGLRWRDLSQATGGLPKLALRSMQYRSGRHVQKRSSLGRKRGRPPSAFRAKKSHGSLASNLLSFRQNAPHSTSATPSRILRSFTKTNPSKYIKELQSAVGMDESRTSTYSKELKTAMGLIPQNAGASFCSANLLVIETDKCYREEGAIITLELSASKQWVLFVTKDGMKRYSLTAQSVMRPSCSNRFTHATLWPGDGGWKLEFPNKRDWLIFKELYKECSERNVQEPTASVIPVPGVQVVSSPDQNSYIPYVRPDSYITVKDDELARAMMKMTANYDMDSDDENWLNEFHDTLSAEGEIHELITPEQFELVVDALEKGFHCNGDDHSDEKAAYDFCMHLERKEFIEAIHKYWIKKRRQKRSALVRIFQLYKPRRSQVLPRSILRKKRSFKRQASQAVRGKQRTFLQEMVAERDTSEHKNNLLKLQEARAIADRSELSAVLKRRRAQILMENADLTTYKAIMALRIAEAAEIADTPGAVASFFLVP
ncbi:hypothetical protein F511_01227 [Dorcoceras hygrometricum]|uniref:Enhancer of polycomb-like protein n=1 Tax=Dorcoceras hygrometricum TaxID=472368 RepID=A0A2Z7BSH2_9LAMI|nr:hypothetical protein F511_01227 [Dorcoceras hygrometricum]